MARLLPFLLVASLVVIAASAFAEEQENSVAEITLNEAIADPAADPEAKRRRGRGGKGGKRRKEGNGRKGGKVRRGGKVRKGGKKGKAMKKRGGRGRTKKNTKRKNRKTKGSKRRKTKKAKKGKKSKGCTRVQNAKCGVNAVEALKFEGTVVDNFITQKKRALNFKGIVDKKKGKKANFANATDNMLDALGGNGNAPVCSVTALRMSRASAADATSNYATLKNCTTTIESDCDIANGTIDEAALEACNKAMFAIKTKNAECIAAADAAAKCACFVDAAKLVADAKAGDCKAKGVAANKAMKAQKTKCTKAFAVCNKAEAAASGLINICLGGDAVSGNPCKQTEKCTNINGFKCKKENGQTQTGTNGTNICEDGCECIREGDDVEEISGDDVEEIITNGDCFNNSGSPKLLSGKQYNDPHMNTVNKCKNFCVSYVYYGVQAGAFCHCGDSLIDMVQHPKVNLDKCNITCPGGTTATCGGKPAYINLFKK